MNYKLNFLFVFFVFSAITARSPHRTPPATMPTIEVQGIDDHHVYKKQDSHLQEYPFFGTYDELFLKNHQLPMHDIDYKDDSNKKVAGTLLSQDLERLIQQVKDGKKKFKSFKVLHKKNFNFNMQCGLLVLKHKKYPFVVKLFIEHPKSFIQPTWKGIDPIFFFYMSGGANRHVAGFTRIKNREYIAQWKNDHEEWRDIIELPRKWFWLPADPAWIQITGKHIGNNEQQTTILPGTYAVIADYFEPESKKHIPKNRQEIIMNLCNELSLYIDPHDNNYIVTQHPVTKKLKIAIIDTEHFPTMVGFDERMRFANHTEWLFYLAGKCLCDIYFRTKSARKKAQLCKRRFYL